MNELLTSPWPWWLGALALSSLTVSIWAIERRLLGVSGSFSRLVTLEAPEDKRTREILEADPHALDDAMLQATIEEFGEEAVAAMLAEQAEDETPVASAAQLRLPKGVHIVFMVMVLVGGVLGATVAGGVEFRGDLGPTYTALIADGWLANIVLLGGGVIVGFGTRMSGGCTSGHGLSGCSRFQPGSLVATATFFGVGVLVSLALAAVAG